MLRLGSILLSSENPSALVDFYRKVLPTDVAWEAGGFTGLLAGDRMLIIGPHEKVSGQNTNPERIIFNFETDDVRGECARLQDLGVTVIQDAYHPDEMDDPNYLIATCCDPDGNYFQLVSPLGSATAEKLADRKPASAGIF